jgi:hypothetical protein
MIKTQRISGLPVPHEKELDPAGGHFAGPIGLLACFTLVRISSIGFSSATVSSHDTRNIKGIETIIIVKSGFSYLNPAAFKSRTTTKPT